MSELSGMGETMEYYDRKATFDVEADEPTVKFVSIQVGEREMPLESKEDIERLSERDQMLLFAARDRLGDKLREVRETKPQALLPGVAHVYWEHISGKMRVELQGAPV
jgi:hypothetical protein